MSYSRNLNAVRHSRSVEKFHPSEPQAVGLRPNWCFGCKPTACNFVCAGILPSGNPYGIDKKQAL